MKKHYILIYLLIAFIQGHSQPCLPQYASLPFAENFERTWLSLCNSNRGFPSANWLNEPLTGNNSWRREDDGASANWYGPGSGQYLTGANGTSHSAMFHTFGVGNNTSGNLSLYIDCSSGYASKELHFYFTNLDGDDSLFVELSTNGGTSFNVITAVNNTGYAWIYKTVPFSSSSPNTILRFKGKKTSNNNSDIQLDEITVSAVNCYTPSIIAKPLTTSVDLYFTPSIAGNPDGYEYAVTQSAAPPATGNFTTGTSATVTGLTNGGSYFAHLRSACTGFGNSSWISQPFQPVAYNCIPDYYYSYWDVFDFTLKGENGSIIRSTNNPTGTYLNYSSSTNVELIKGKSYSAIFNFADTITSFSCWIDFNDDGAFTYTEKVINDFTWRHQQYIPISFYIPANAARGAHRMRIRTNAGDACEKAEDNGQAQDYTITIIDGTPGSYNVSTPIANNCTNGGNIMINRFSNTNNVWVPLTDTSNNLIASINANGNNLGRVNVYEYVNAGSIRRTTDGKAYLDRNFQIAVEYQPISPVSVRFYLLKSEFDALRAADPAINSLNDLWLTKTSQECGSVMGQGQLLQPVNTGVIGNDYFVEYSVPSFSSFYFHGGLTVLPVTLTKLSIYKEDDVDQLTWETLSEQDSQGFEVEASNDGISFKKIDFVSSKAIDGKSSGRLSYTFNVKSSSANAYYRVKNINKDGRSSFSNVVFAKSIATESLRISSIFPNPAKTATTIDIVARVPNKITIVITNVWGETVSTTQYSMKTSSSNVIINTSGFPAGTYFIKVISSTGIQSNGRFVKL
jgi:hypothetical protein